MRKINEIIIHWSATSTGDVESIRHYHRLHNKWSDIGYHFVINRLGDVQKGRCIDKVGAHCKNHNSHSIGVCVIGSPNDQPNNLQISALSHLIDSLNLIFGDLKLSCHSDYANTECPGKTLQTYIHFLTNSKNYD